MAQIITNETQVVNNYSALSGFKATPLDDVPSNQPHHYLSKLEKALLNFHYDLRSQGFEETDYSLEEYAVRFKCHVVYISRSLSTLEEYGYMGSRHGGSTNKKRWITYEAFSMLENQRLRQKLNQNESTHYIDLSDQRSDQLKIIEEAQNCGKPNIEEQLTTFLEEERVSPSERMRIKKAIKTAPIGPVRRESLIRRVIQVGKKSFIGNKLAYFLEAVRNEMKNMKEVAQQIAKAGLRVNEYQLDDLGDIGCYC
jgi:hypothetical protein